MAHNTLNRMFYVKKKIILKVGIVPDRRRLGRVYAVRAVVLACFAGKRRKKRGSGGLGKKPKSGAVGSQHGPARVEVRSYEQRATIPSKRVVYILKYPQSTTHAIINIMCLVLKANIFSPVEV